MTHRTYKQYHKIIYGIEHKQCKGCNEWFPMTDEYYGSDKRNKDKFNTYCKSCQKKNQDEYYAKTKDHQKETVRKWQENNPEKFKKIMKMVNSNPSEKTLATRRNYSKQCREDGTRKDWEDKNKEKLKVYGKNHKEHNITQGQWKFCKNYFGNTCAYCGLPIEHHIVKRNGKYINMDFHKEHVDDEGTNGLENCIPSCGTCNSSKRSNKFDIWYNPNSKRRGGKVYTEERYNKIIKWITEDYKQYI